MLSIGGVCVRAWQCRLRGELSCTVANAQHSTSTVGNNCNPAWQRFQSCDFFTSERPGLRLQLVDNIRGGYLGLLETTRALQELGF
jgi:hypothetical protein